MSIRERLDEDFKAVLKSSDEIGRGILRMVKAEIKNREIEKGADTQLDDDGIIDAFFSVTKKCREAVHHYEEGGRQDLADKEKAEIKFLARYLPEQLTEEELHKKINEAIEKVGATDMKQMGQVMKTVMAEVGKRADGSQVNRLVKEILQK